MLSVGVRKDLHEDERAAPTLDDPGHRAKRRAGYLIACRPSASISLRQTVPASGSAPDILHDVERVVVVGASDRDPKNVLHGVHSIRARTRLERRRRARVGFGMENGPAPSEDEHGPAMGSNCRASLRGLGFDPDASAPVLLDQSPDIFGRFESR